MRDIIDCPEGEDLVVMDSIVAKAGNVLSIQLGSLEYAPQFGVDLRFFLESDFIFQNESFKAYMIQRLTESQVNVSQVTEEIQSLFNKYTYFVGEATVQNEGFIL